jgi:hypothetical protein
MIKRFCDQCGKELFEDGDRRKLMANVAGKRLSGQCGALGFEVIISQNGTANKGDYCGYCVLDAVASIDDRPKEARVP